MDTSVFVTGANGFLGRALVDRLPSDVVRVVGMDRFGDSERGVVGGDITEPATWEHHLAGIDVVIHTAAVVTNNVAPADAWNTNVIGTQRVLRSAAAHGVRRFVYISTMGVARYGQIAVDAVARFASGVELDEGWPLMPVGNPYTDTKIAAEHAVLAAHAAGEIDVTVVRPADVYGPGCRPWVLEPLAAIQAGRFLLPAHGEGLFTAIFIDDLVDGILAASTSDRAAGHIVHFGGESPVTTAEYFGHFYRMLGRDGPPRSFSTRVAVVLAEGARGVARLRGRHTELGRGVMEMLAKTRPVSNRKAHELLGWLPQVDLDEGMRRTEVWLRDEGHLPADVESGP